MISYDEKNSPLITEDEKLTARSLLTTSMLDEIHRLRSCCSGKERSEIRQFILECGKILAECSQKDERQESVQGKM